MSGRLDQTLDSIIDSQKKAKKQQRRNKPRPAPVGGVKKAVKAAKPAVKTPPTAAPRPPKNSKIVVSGLPLDVSESQIKEYFGKSVGPIKKVSVHYNQNGDSRGVADIIFAKPESAAKAAREQNGIKIDQRPMKASKQSPGLFLQYLTLAQVEVVVDASQAREPPTAKSLAERVAYDISKPNRSVPLTKTSANPKAQPKSAVAKKDSNKDVKTAKGKPQKKARSARPKPKTAAELDTEMDDYFDRNTSTAAVEAPVTSAAPAADAMEEISVRLEAGAQ